MWPSVLPAYTAITQKNEGVVPHMYVDVVGLVTTGTGNLIDSGSHPLANSGINPDSAAYPIIPFESNGKNGIDVAGLDWRKWKSSSSTAAAPESAPKATPEEIAAEWTMFKNKRGELYNKGTAAKTAIATLRLTQAGVDQLFNKALRGFEGALKSALPEWDSWPADAQMAALLMAWAMGAGFASKGWPSWRAAALKQDFTTASIEGQAKSMSNARNAAIKTSFLNAADVIAHGGDKSQIHYSGLQHAADTVQAKVQDVADQAHAIASGEVSVSQVAEDDLNAGKGMGEAFVGDLQELAKKGGDIAIKAADIAKSDAKSVAAAVGSVPMGAKVGAGVAAMGLLYYFLTKGK